MPSVVSRLQTAAEGTRAITFVGSAAGDAGPADRVEWARLHEDAAAWPPRSRRAVSVPVCTSGCSDRPRVRWSPPSRRSPWPAAPWSPSPSPCGWGRSRSSWSRPVGASPTPTPNWWPSTVTSHPSSTRSRLTPGRAPPPCCSTTSSRQEHGSAPRRGCARPTTPSGWRSCSSPVARPRHRRASCSPTGAWGRTSTPSSRRPGSPTPTPPCPGSRCTTTWASSGC